VTSTARVQHLRAKGEAALPLMGNMRIATAGWSIPRDARETIAASGSSLERYATVLGATEINTTFYRRHRSTTFERWRDSVPSAFRFAVKMPRTITHEAGLVAPRIALRELCDDIRGLGAKLGPILVQLPASFPFDRRRVDTFFRTLRGMHDGRVACEPRNATWYTDDASEVLSRYDIARVVADPPRPAAAARPAETASFAYYRLHGSPRVYWSSYDAERLESLAAELRSFSKTKVVWVVFDNTASGAAWVNAERLAALVRASHARAHASA
jgi:uncharacterized protein YecE (DUF72 family)